MVAPDDDLQIPAMIEELDAVVLTRAFPEHFLAEGDLGTVIRRNPGSRGFQVQFLTAGGRPLAMLTLRRDDVRPLAEDEILHARRLRFS